MISRRVVLGAPLGGLALASLGGAAAHGTPGVKVPERRIFSASYADITNGSDRIKRLAARFDEIHANEVAISMGRIEKALFPWRGQILESDSPQADQVQEVIDAIAVNGGCRRPVTLILDALIPEKIKRDPTVAGVSTKGEVSGTHPSLKALTRGEIGEKIIEMAAEAARRYQPTAISLTDLYFEDTTYGQNDLEDFTYETGASDWPRRNGEIDVSDPLIVSWRCQALASLVRRVREAVNAAAPNRPELWMEVKAPLEDANGDRKDAGQDYGLLAERADRLVLWNYFDNVTDTSPSTRDLAAAFAARSRGRDILSIGLWGRDDSTITPEKLNAAAKEAVEGGSTAVWVTPSDLMTDAHWKALAEAWRR